MSWTIRPSRPEDLDQIIVVFNETAPMHKLNRAEWLRDEQTLAPELQRMTFVAESDDTVVGIAIARRMAGSYHPQKYLVEMGVTELSRKQGIGKALYQTVFEHLADLGLLSISCQVAESNSEGMRFADKRGYTEQKRDFVSNLDLSTFDPSAFACSVQGLEIRSLEELDSPEMRRQWYDLFSAVRQDIPRSSPPTPLAFDFFEKQIVTDPDLSRTATVFAFIDGQMVGFSAGFQEPDFSQFNHWLTATHRDYRGKGVAYALKVALAAEAKRLGIEKIQTDNDTRNKPMLAINDKLGFIRQPAVLSMSKDFWGCQG